ncbi:O-antigen ligase family protein [Glaciihabitans tibetensis]|nr:O-antigen ligase family protein [Glaciihabitans tibetensis]
MSTRNLGSSFVLAAALTSSWTGVRYAEVGLSDVLLALALLVFLVQSGLGFRRLRIPLWYFAPPLIALVVLGVGTIFLGSDGAADGLTFVLRLFLSMTVVATLVSSEGDTFGANQTVRVLRFWAFGVALAGLAAITDLVGLTDFSVVISRSTGERATGLAFHPNSLAFSLTLAIPVLGYLVSRSHTKLGALLWLGVVVVCAVSLYLADSRAGLVVGYCALIATGLILINSTRSRWALAPVGLLSIPAYILFVAPFLSTTRLSGDAGTAQSNAGRTEFANEAFRSFAANPLVGSGFGGGAGVAVPLVLASSGGIALILAYYVFIARVAKTIASGERGPARSLFLLSALSVLVFGFLNNGVSERFIFWPILIAASLLADRGFSEADVSRRASP